MYYYPAFNPAADSTKLQMDVRRNVSRETAWESVIRIRCTSCEPAAALSLSLLLHARRF